MVSQPASKLVVCVGRDLCLTVGCGTEKRQVLATETLELVHHCHLWPILLDLPLLYADVSSIFHSLFFTALNSRVKVKGKIFL